MIGILRLAFFGFICLTGVYLLVAIYARSVRREELEKEYDAGGVAGDRDAYIKAGMNDYERGLKRRLLWLIYIFPALVVALTIYFVNYQ